MQFCGKIIHKPTGNLTFTSPLPVLHNQIELFGQFNHMSYQYL